MTFIDIFSGIGTIRMGFEKVNHECVFSIEKDKFKRKMYEVIFGNEPEGKDINDVKTSDIPKSDCWCFGFSCKDTSIAGKQEGLSGERSGTFYKVIEKLKEKEDKPTFLFIENVKNLVSINDGWDFFRVLLALDEIGYDAEWDVINSSQVVPQNRERVYIIGHLRGKPWKGIFPVREYEGISNKTFKKKKQIAPCLRAKQGGNDIDEVYIQENGIWRSLTWKETWRLQTIPEHIISRIDAAGFSRTRLRMAAGDACTVDVIAKIAEKMNI